MALLLSAVLGGFSVAQSPRRRFDPAGHGGSAKPQDSFLDFTLKRINPSYTDYGKCLGESRTVLLDQTVRNAYFWSNIVALGVLGFLFFVVLYQHKTQTQREWAFAEIIEQLQHSLNRSHAQIAEFRCQLPPSPRDSGGNLRDQPRTTAPSRGTLKGRHERIPGCPPRPDRCGIGRHPPGQYAGRLARQRFPGFAHRGGS